MPETSTGALAAAIALGLLTLTPSGVAAQAPAGSECLCAPASSADGIYWAQVEGGEQVRVVEVLEARTSADEPDFIVVPGLTASPGDEVLVGGRAWLIVDGGGRIRCPSGVCGDAYSVDRATAERLVLANDCLGELEFATISGAEPECAGGDGGLTCAAAGGSRGAIPPALAVAALAWGAQRRRRASRSTHTA